MRFTARLHEIRLQLTPRVAQFTALPKQFEQLSLILEPQLDFKRGEALHALNGGSFRVGALAAE